MFIHVQFAGLILLNICVTIFSNLFLQFARGVGDNKNFAIACAITGVTTLAATILLIVVAHMGAQGMLLSIALANLACVIYLFFALKIYRYISFKEHDKTLQKKLIAYSFPLVPNGVSWWVINVSDRTIISIVIGVAANGIYAVANKYAAIFTSIFGIFSMSWTESASVHIDDKDRDTFFSDTINASVRLFGSLGLTLIAFIPLIFTLLINSQYGEAYLYIPVLIVAAFFNGIVGLYSAIYVAKKLTKRVASTSIMAAGISITLNLILINFIGLWAAAIATAAAYAAMSVYRHYDVKKYVTITYEKNIFVKLAALYALTMVLYYYNNVVGNIANAIIITIVAILLNKSVIKVIKNKVLSLGGRKPKKLTPEQEVYEDSI
jgi:O-antigen/teichoic acid export membrane protein